MSDEAAHAVPEADTDRQHTADSDHDETAITAEAMLLASVASAQAAPEFEVPAQSEQPTGENNSSSATSTEEIRFQVSGNTTVEAMPVNGATADSKSAQFVAEMVPSAEAIQTAEFSEGIAVEVVSVTEFQPAAAQTEVPATVQAESQVPDTVTLSDLPVSDEVRPAKPDESRTMSSNENTDAVSGTPAALVETVSPSQSTDLGEDRSQRNPEGENAQSSEAGVAPAIEPEAAPITPAAMAAIETAPVRLAPLRPLGQPVVAPRIEQLLPPALRGIRLSAEAGHEISLRLNPPELGALLIDVRVLGGQINARLMADNSAAHQALRDGIPQLREQLVKQGFEVNDLRVELGREETNSGQNSTDSRFHQGSQGQPETHTPDFDWLNLAAPKVTVAQVRRQSLGLDIQV